MPAIYLEFHGPRHARTRLSPVLFALGAAAWLGNLATMTALERESERVAVTAREVASLERRLTAANAAQVRRKEDRAALLRVMAQGGHEAALAALESAWNSRLALLKADMRLADRRLTLELEAKSLDDGLAFVDALRATPPFQSVRLSRHGVKAENPDKPVAFSLEAGWQAPPQPHPPELPTAAYATQGKQP